MVTLLHTSDVHIGWARSDHDAAHLDTCLCPVLGVLAAADDHDVDALLVAGDLFDHGRLATDVLDTTLGLLEAAARPVVVIPGNHDVHDERSVWRRASWRHLVVLDDHEGRSVDLLDGRLSIWGRAMPVHDRSYRPLVGAPERPPDRHHVVMGHGFHDVGPEAGYRSSPITPDDVAATAADYVALGHIHVRRDVSSGRVPAWYCGAPTGVTSSGTANLIRLRTPGTGDAEVTAVPVRMPSSGCTDAVHRTTAA